MSGKKAKVSSHAKKSASSAAKSSVNERAGSARSGGAKNASKKEKSGPIGSIKKMLGLGAKGSAAAKSSEKASKGASVAKPQPKGLAKVGAKTSAPDKHEKHHEPKQTGRPSKGAHGKESTRSKAALDLSGPPVCREVACELMATTGGYCRMHYIKNWKKIKRKEMILKEKKLNSYIEELVSKYPDKYIEAIRQDLASEKDFAKVIADLEIEEGLDDFESVETESAEGIIDNLKRDFEDEGDVF